ncbi:MAG TPA: class I SAM-dependent methyltransferase [Ktedonobacteraceae bacterium]|nr:class I SAM-dependent methyltransferase [Ktedonobacteraceae bacterium]
MATADTPREEEEGKYFTDTENAAEIARLVRQSHTITKILGQLFPHGLDLRTIHDVLDIACGPGTWALEVTQLYPQMQVTGFDISRHMIDYARSIAATEGKHNAHFRVMDATKALDFPDGSFDLINARFIFGFMRPTTWPRLLQECQRLLRPGGTIILTEGELPITTSLAFERISRMFAQALKAVGQSFSADGGHLGITPVLARLVREAGFREIQQLFPGFDMSAGTDLHKDFFYPNFVSAFKLDQPFLIQAGVTKQEEIDRLYSQMLDEVNMDDFAAINYGLIVWGKKP